jgi:flagellar motor switch/type III secretory pathway protein FliN
MGEPKFSAYPFESLRRVSRPDAAIESMVARWLGARPIGDRLGKLVGGPVRVELGGGGGSVDPNAAVCEIRIGGAAVAARGSSMAVRQIAQQLLGGPAELAAPRPLGVIEHAIWALIVATAVEDLGIAAEVWPCEAPDLGDPYALELAVDLGGTPLTVTVTIPRALELRAPPHRPPPAWTDRVMLAVPIVLGRCAITRMAVRNLAVRDAITLDPPLGGGSSRSMTRGDPPLGGGSSRSMTRGDPPLGGGASRSMTRRDPPRSTAELAIGSGAVGVHAVPGAVVAEVATGYGPRDMSLPDDAHVELTVALGTLQLSLRQVFELAIGQIVPLGRPLAGPFELRAAGQLVGRGELVNVDGELAVRVVSLGQE